MFSLISKLQRKPERIRKKIAVAVSAVLTGIIVLFWLVSLGSSFEEAASKPAPTEEDDGPFKTLSEGLGDFFTDAAETLQTAAGAFSGLSGNMETIENTASNTPVESVGSDWNK